MIQTNLFKTDKYITIAEIEKMFKIAKNSEKITIIKYRTFEELLQKLEDMKYKINK